MKKTREAFPSPVLGEGSTPAGGRVRAAHNATTALTPTLSHNWERGTTSLKLIAIVLLCGSILAGLFLYFKPCANFNQATLQTPTQTITVALAHTSELQATGLSGCRSVPKNAGMYFGPFDTSQDQKTNFWMKGMVIPIDIIWLKNNQVIGIEKNVPNQPLDAPDETIPRYVSPVPVDAVLEVGAGKAEEYGITEGAELRVVDEK